MIRTGKLRHRIAIQSRATTQDTFGQVTGAWSTDATVWGSIEPLTGAERFEAQKVTPGVSHKITIRHGTTVTPESRLVNDSRNFGVISVLNTDEMDHELVIIAKEDV